ncbi:hypothetical protein B0H19DRAFT_687099 [Mycena capillaripes]|nr:hypothetical protein B0H19DRAFT_687099 [Mycena capillaripes]
MSASLIVVVKVSTASTTPGPPLAFARHLPLLVCWTRGGSEDVSQAASCPPRRRWDVCRPRYETWNGNLLRLPWSTSQDSHVAFPTAAFSSRICRSSAERGIVHLLAFPWSSRSSELQALWTVARFTPHSLFVILTRLPYRPQSIPETASHRWAARRACGGNKAIPPSLPLQPCLTCHNWGVHDTFPGHGMRGLTGIRAEYGSVVTFMHQQSRGGGADTPGEPHMRARFAFFALGAEAGRWY